MNAIVRCESPLSALSSLFDDFLGSNFYEATGRDLSNYSWPRVDISENDQSFVIKADVPGIDKNDIAVGIENGTLRIEGEKKEEYKSEKGKYHHFERSYGKFSRSFALPEGVDAEKIEAKMNNGVLELVLPKVEQARPKSIEVKIN